MQKLIKQAGEQLVRRRFTSTAELIGALYAALIQDLEARGLLRNGPFDAAPCISATLADLDEERIVAFISTT